MTRTTQLFKIIAVSKLLALLFTTISYGQQYRAIPLVHPDGRFYASGMNNLGQVCGTVLVDEVNFINHAVRYEQDSTFTTLTLGENGKSSTASNMNEHGHVIGTINTTDFTSRVGVWETESTFRELSQPEGFITIFPKDINDRGEAVGYTLTNNPQAYFWDAAGDFHELPQRGYGAEAIALNDSSHIGGRVYDSVGNSIPALWEPDNGPGNGDQGFTLIELDEPSPNARINDISNAIFYIPSNDSTQETLKSGNGMSLKVILGGYTERPETNIKTAVIYTISGDRFFLDEGEFESETNDIGNDGTIYGSGSNILGGFDGVAWSQTGFKSPDFSRIKFNDIGDGSLIAEAHGGNFSRMFLGDPQIDPTLWKINYGVAISSIKGNSSWEFGNSNRSAPDFNITHGLDFEKFIWGVDHRGTYQNVQFNPLNDNGWHWIIPWNGMNGATEKFGVGGTLNINGLTNLGNVKSGPKLDLHLIGGGDFAGGIWNLGGNKATFFADEGETNEYKIGGDWLTRGKFITLGLGLNKFVSNKKETSFPSTNFGDGVNWTNVDISNSITEVGGRTLTFDDLSIRMASVEFRGFDDVETDSITITDGELTAEEQVKIYIRVLQIFLGGILDVNELVGNSNSTVEIGEGGQLSADHFRFDGLTFENSGICDINILEFGNTERTQELIISDPEKLIIQELITENQELIMHGKAKVNTLILKSGVTKRAGPRSIVEILENVPEIYPIGGNHPESGSVTSANQATFLEVPLQRTINGFKVPLSNDKNKAYNNPVGLNGRSSPMIIQPVAGSSSEDPTVSVEVIDLAEEGSKLPGDFKVSLGFNYQYLKEDGWKVKVSLPISFKSSSETDSLRVNIRIPAFGLENVKDLDQYRLLLFDCDGNFQGLAGDFMAPSSEPQSSVLYTGMIDGVFNITHTNVPLDTCQYIVLASSEAPSSVNDPSVHEGYTLKQNQPNPFSLSTNISYSLAGKALVKLSVYNVLGQQVRSLVTENQAQGEYTVEWDGTNDSGRVLSGGVYFCRMEISNQEIGLVLLSHKMVLR